MSRPAAVGEIVAPEVPGSAEVLAPDALALVGQLQRRFGARRAELLTRRRERQRWLDAGVRPGFPDDAPSVRVGDWRVADAPPDLQDRRVEITGPAEPKMIINALNSGAQVFTADFEDAFAPSWPNVVAGQAALRAAARRTLRHTSPEGKEYALGPELATLVVRPRGWHLDERHVLVDGEAISASLFDAGLYLFHNAAELLERGSGPYLYLPKLESRHEAALWRDVLRAFEQELGLAPGTIRVTVLIETVLAALEMEEIFYELRDYAVGLNAGRWDYVFSMIKKFRADPAFVLPDRDQVTMTVPFMHAYTERLVAVCHRRGAHAIGGLAAFVPSRHDPAVNELAYARVRQDKEREAAAGFDGTRVAHPDLVAVAREAFDAVLGDRPHQKDRLRDDVHVTADDLLDTSVPGGRITRAGVRANIGVAIRYLAAWLNGSGAVALDNLMEDAATADIARAQLWQWIRHGAALDDGTPVTADLYRGERDAWLAGAGNGRFAETAALLDRLVLAPEFEDFLTLPAYQMLP